MREENERKIEYPVQCFPGVTPHVHNTSMEKACMAKNLNGSERTSYQNTITKAFDKQTTMHHVSILHFEAIGMVIWEREGLGWSYCNEGALFSRIAVGLMPAHQLVVFTMVLPPI